MKALMIPPTPELPRYGTGDMHLTLAHLMDGSSGLWYTQFYRRQSSEAYIILDNSAFEMGSSPYTINQLIHKAQQIGARELVLPDVLRDAGATLKALIPAAQEFAMGEWGHGLKPMYVPQGRDHDEWTTCMYSILALHEALLKDKPFTIGIPRHCDEPAFKGSRYGLLLEIAAILDYVNCDIHLLGWSDIPALAKMSRDFPWVRSVDSSKPFVWAAKGKYLHQLAEGEPEPQRPDNYFDIRYSEDEREVVYYNIRAFERAAERGWQLPEGVV